MLYYSTKGKSEAVSLKEAVLKGLAEDGGLYMPRVMPSLPDTIFSGEAELTPIEISREVALAFLSDDVPGDVVSRIVEETMNFPVPLREVMPGVYSLELYHGPTLAFKDFGARFMSRLMGWLCRHDDSRINVVTATSGDTGSAVAAGFYGVEGINVFILFPRGQVSRLQQKQITTWGDNIYALEVDGSFDDCHRIAKQLLGDRKLGSHIPLTSANSINIARLIPQSFYYFIAYRILARQKLPVVFSVPSGNFGNLTGGLMAAAAGLPVRKFIAPVNINDVFPRFLESGTYMPAPSKRTISNAMDVGDPGNFARISKLMGNSIDNFRESIVSWSFNDNETRKAVRDVYETTGYVMDPHGAVAYMGLKRYAGSCTDSFNGVFLETAHPAKFREVMEEIIEGYREIPERLEAFDRKKEEYTSLGNSTSEVKDFILGVNY